VIAIVFGALCALSFNVLKDVKVWDFTIFDIFEYVSSNILLPVGGLFFAWFVGWYIDKKIVTEQFTNYGDRKITLFRPIIFCIRYIAPIGILLVFLYGLGALDFVFRFFGWR
jgi:NSS family neurotransmitter:Na+ symporter